MSTPKASILLVDDEKNLRFMASAVLTNAGYGVASVATAEEGLEAIRKTGFHLALVDYMLPKEDGVWMIEQANRELSPAPPSVIMTALAVLKSPCAR